MNNFKAIIDFGSKNLRLGIFDKSSKNIYSSEQKISNNLESTGLDKSLEILIRNAEKYLSTHIDNVLVLYDSPNFYSLDLSIKKVFDYITPIKKVYNTLIEESHFLVSQNNFKDKIIHLVVNNILIDGNKKLDKFSDDINIKSLTLDIKFICLSKFSLDQISNKFKKNNLKILNLYCSSYVKTIFYKKQFDIKDHIIFLDIGYERTSSIAFNNCKFDFFKSIPLGNNNITKDISRVLKLNLDYSESLKIQLNKNESDILFTKGDNNKLNPYMEIIEKNISTDLLKKIIEARVNEIMELVIFQSDYIKNLRNSTKPKLAIIGYGSALLSNNLDINIFKSISKLYTFDEADSHVCKAGLDYHLSSESRLGLTKKKIKKSGFFETFFNFFSK